MLGAPITVSFGYALLSSYYSHRYRNKFIHNYATPLSLQLRLRILGSEAYNFLLVGFASLYSLYFKKSHVAQGINTRLPPILLIHGYCGTGAAFLWLKKELHTRYGGEIFVVRLSKKFSSIELLAENLAEIVNSLGIDKFNIVGYSMGGIVAAYYNTKLAKPGSVLTLITVSSPLHGTYIANIGFGENIKQIKIGSEFLENLRKNIRSGHGTIYHHIATRSDNVIIPWDSAWLVGSNNNSFRYLLDNVGHFELMLSHKLVKALAGILNGSLMMLGKKDDFKGSLTNQYSAHRSAEWGRSDSQSKVDSLRNNSAPCLQMLH